MPKKSKFSDGIRKFDGTFYQVATIQQIQEFYVDCPFCGDTIDCNGDTDILECADCKKRFLAEWG